MTSMRTPIRLKKNKIRGQLLWNGCLMLSTIVLIGSAAFHAYHLPGMPLPLLVFFGVVNFGGIGFMLFLYVHISRVYVGTRFELDDEGYSCAMPTVFSTRRTFVPWDRKVNAGRIPGMPWYGIRDKDWFKKGAFHQNESACFVPPRDWIENLDEVDAALKTVPPGDIADILRE